MAGARNPATGTDGTRRRSIPPGQWNMSTPPSPGRCLTLTGKPSRGIRTAGGRRRRGGAASRSSARRSSARQAADTVTVVHTADRGQFFQVTTPNGYNVPLDPWNPHGKAEIRTPAQLAAVLARQGEDMATLEQVAPPVSLAALGTISSQVELASAAAHAKAHATASATAKAHARARCSGSCATRTPAGGCMTMTRWKPQLPAAAPAPSGCTITYFVLTLTTTPASACPRLTCGPVRSSPSATTTKGTARPHQGSRAARGTRTSRPGTRIRARSTRSPSRTAHRSGCSPARTFRRRARSRPRRRGRLGRRSRLHPFQRRWHQARRSLSGLSWCPHPRCRSRRSRRPHHRHGQPGSSLAARGGRPLKARTCGCPARAASLMSPTPKPPPPAPSGTGIRSPTPMTTCGAAPSRRSTPGSPSRRWPDGRSGTR